MVTKFIFLSNSNSWSHQPYIEAWVPFTDRRGGGIASGEWKVMKQILTGTLNHLPELLVGMDTSYMNRSWTVNHEAEELYAASN